MAARQAAGAVETAPVRIRAAQFDLHAAVEAGADPARARRPCRRLGRSAHADDRRPEAARRAAGGDPRIRQAHRRCQGQQRGRRRHAGILHPRNAQQDGAAAHGGAAAAQGGDRELSGRRRSRRSRPSTIRTIPRPAPAASRSAASSISSATTSWRIRRRNSSGSRRATKCGCATPISSSAARSIKNAAGEVIELRCTYDPATKGGNAPDGRKVKATMHWLPAAQSLPAEIRIYNQLFVKPDAGRRQFRRRSQSAIAGNSRPMRGSSPRSRKAIRPSRCSSSGRAISCATRIQRRTARCSTGPSACATPSPRKSAKG